MPPYTSDRSSENLSPMEMAIEQEKDRQQYCSGMIDVYMTEYPGGIHKTRVSVGDAVYLVPNNYVRLRFNGRFLAKVEQVTIQHPLAS